MSDLKIYDDYNTLPEQVQINKDDIKTLNAKIDTITSNIANLGWELKTNTAGDKSYIPKNFDENIPYSLTNITDFTQASGLNTYKDSDGYVWSYLSIYIPDDDDYVGIRTGHDNTDGYFCSLSMAVPNDKTTYLVVTYIANSDCPQSLNKDTYKEDETIATMGWVNKYYLTKTDASNTYLKKTDALDIYVTKQDYNERFDTGDISFTAQGWNKIKDFKEEPGQDIILTIRGRGDFLEYVRLTGHNDVILQFFYNSNTVFENIYLHPNNTIGDLDDFRIKTTYYSGQAVIVLPSQDVGLFDIAYQEGEFIILHLITIL